MTLWKVFAPDGYVNSTNVDIISNSLINTSNYNDIMNYKTDDFQPYESDIRHDFTTNQNYMTSNFGDAISDWNAWFTTQYQVGGDPITYEGDYNSLKVIESQYTNFKNRNQQELQKFTDPSDWSYYKYYPIYSSYIYDFNDPSQDPYSMNYSSDKTFIGGGDIMLSNPLSIIADYDKNNQYSYLNPQGITDNIHKMITRISDKIIEMTSKMTLDDNQKMIINNLAITNSLSLNDKILKSNINQDDDQESKFQKMQKNYNDYINTELLDNFLDDIIKMSLDEYNTQAVEYNDKIRDARVTNPDPLIVNNNDETVHEIVQKSTDADTDDITKQIRDVFDPTIIFNLIDLDNPKSLIFTFLVTLIIAYLSLTRQGNNYVKSTVNYFQRYINR